MASQTYKKWTLENQMNKCFALVAHVLWFLKTINKHSTFVHLITITACCTKSVLRKLQFSFELRKRSVTKCLEVENKNFCLELTLFCLPWLRQLMLDVMAAIGRMTQAGQQHTGFKLCRQLHKVEVLYRKDVMHTLPLKSLYSSPSVWCKLT